MNSYDRNVKPQKEDLSIVIIGHVDHGKSTVIGRMLADTDSLPQGKLEQVREKCRRNSKPFEYAFLLDALKDEQEQGITIDSARCFFKTQKRNYILIDAPGHKEFLKNMVTGASRAEAALLVIDAMEGIMENTIRHVYLLSLLGKTQVCVLINKMDLVGYDRSRYETIVLQLKDILAKVNVTTSFYIPVSGFEGDNIFYRSGKTEWYSGPSVIEALDSFEPTMLSEDKPFRMPVQGVYKFTSEGDDRRIIAGTIESGKVRVGDELIFYPSGKKSRIRSIEAFNESDKSEIGAGYSTGLTLTEQIYVKRGEIAALPSEPAPRITTRMRATLFWLGKEPMEPGREYILKLGTARVNVQIESIIRIIDAATLETSETGSINRHQAADCILKLDKQIAFDICEEFPPTGRFVIVDNFEIVGGGIIQEALEDLQSNIRDKVRIRDIKWEKSGISEEARAEKYAQRPVLILITGKKDSGKKKVARALEKKLFDEGRIVYFMGIGNFLYGVDSDIREKNQANREEHFRRLAEVANLMLNAGVILIITAIDIKKDDIDILTTVVSPEKIEVVVLGDMDCSDYSYSLRIREPDPVGNSVEMVKGLLRDKGVIFKLL